MCKVTRRTHTDPLFYSLGILKLFDQIQCHNVLFLHKILTTKFLNLSVKHLQLCYTLIINFSLFIIIFISLSISHSQSLSL